METQKTSPTKVGLLIVALSYFLFTAHDLFNLQWVGEWNRGHTFLTTIFVEDINAEIGLICRVIAALIALVAILYYLRKPISTVKTYFVLRLVAIFEAIYWFGLIATTYFDTRNFIRLAGRGFLRLNIFGASLTFNFAGDLAESIVLPIVLLILAYYLNPNKPKNKPVIWATITGTIYIIVFWLTNTGAWLSATLEKGIGYLTGYPQNLASLIITAGGLLALGIFAAGFAVTSRKKSLHEVNPKIVGVIITLLGLYFFWNYLSWIVFGTPYSSWVAWFLGHNLDLWMLSLPLFGLTLLFSSKHTPVSETAQKQICRTDECILENLKS